MERYNKSSYILIKIHNKNYILSPKENKKRFTTTTIPHKKDAGAQKNIALY